MIKCLVIQLFSIYFAVFITRLAEIADFLGNEKTYKNLFQKVFCKLIYIITFYNNFNMLYIIMDIKINRYIFFMLIGGVQKIN